MILGIYFNEKKLEQLYKTNLPSKMNFLAEEALKEDIQTLIFSPLSINWITRNIHGLTYNISSKTWESTVCPFPNVIYDLATFNDEEKETGRLVRERLSTEYKLPFINSKSYFNKWETHEVLSKDSTLAKYLPDTARYYHFCQLIDFLDKYNSIYIKDSGGKLGKNIFKLQKAEDGFCILNYQSCGDIYSYKLTPQDIHNKFIANRFLERNIIIQQGIDVAALNEHPFDIRTLAQKNESGKWEVVDKSIRVAAPGSIVTNVSNGSEVQSFNKIIPILFSNSTFISAEVDMLVIKACETLEEKYGLLGELGIDIAIDKGGGIWLLEVNGKPSKLCIYYSGNQELISRSCKNIIRYSKSIIYGGYE